MRLTLEELPDQRRPSDDGKAGRWGAPLVVTLRPLDEIDDSDGFRPSETGCETSVACGAVRGLRTGERCVDKFVPFDVVERRDIPSGSFGDWDDHALSDESRPCRKWAADGRVEIGFD